MNIEIKVDGLEIKVQNITKDHANNLVLAAIQFVKGKEFRSSNLETKDSEIIPENIHELNAIEKDKHNAKEHRGLKVLPDGTTNHRCAYKCPCGKHGRRYIKDMDSPVHCHQCNMKLEVQPSTLNDACDEEENYFLAY